ncbi:TVP38/TMEM64 family protein [Bacillus sp. Bva_UNVM-123]|uniref:TVP38/TMEM64 family protein n=1 Tax=Bacillus sp. Bva_UNVM-123 TaxID=2829798 RepID=UPI00391F6958
MKTFLRGILHFIAAFFLFFLIGMALASILLKIKLLDMMFDSEYIITVTILTGIWFFFARVFMNANNLGIWEKRKISIITALISFIVSLVLLSNSLTILPAYMVSKAFFLENLVSLEMMNILLIIGFIIGAVALFAVLKMPLILKKETKMQWDKLSSFNRFGMMALFGLLAIFLLLYLGQGGIREFVNLAISYLKNADVEGFRDYLLSFGSRAAVVSGLLMVFQSVMAPLPAFVITFANGLLFGWFFGAILSWSSAMLGAIVCFYLAKFLGRPVVEKIVTKKALNWWDQFFAKYGKHSVFIARLVPIVSFDLVSYAAGVTSISFWQFFWATGLGQLPATILYSYLGQTATDTVKILFFLFTIVIALAVIGMILRPKLNQLIKYKKLS